MLLKFKKSMPENCAECHIFKYCPEKLNNINNKHIANCVLKAWKYKNRSGKWTTGVKAKFSEIKNQITWKQKKVKK